MASTFSLLASGCHFDKSRHGNSRRQFGNHSEAAAAGLQGGSLLLGGLDFFGGDAAASGKNEMEPAAPDSSAAASGLSKKKRRKGSGGGAGPEDDADEAADGSGSCSTDPTLASMSERETADANALRRAMRIHVYGTSIPAPVQSAEHMSERYQLKPWLRTNILESGYHELTRVQMQAMPLLLGGREVLACAPTGSGKTAAFLVPMLQKLGGPRRRGIRAVAIAPTQELARQTHRELLKLCAGSGIQACVLSKKLAAAATAHAEHSSGKADAATDGGGGGGGGGGGSAGVWRKYDVMVCTPLRLVSLLRKGVLSLSGVTYLALDEADKLLELGFLEQVDEVLASVKDNPNVQRALFSATMQPAIEDLVHSVLRNPAKLVVGERNGAADTIEQSLVFCGREDGKLVALRQMVREGIQPPVLIFVQSVERAMQLFHELVYDGLNVDVLHADRSQAQRDATVQKFRAGKVWVLIATELVARGMDFKGVSLVVNYDFPQSTTSYIHRIGRTGRAGRQGKAVTFFTEADAEQLRSIANVMKASGCPVPDWMLQMKKPTKDERRRRAVKPLSRKGIAKAPKEGGAANAGGKRPRDAEDESDDGEGGGPPAKKKKKAKPNKPNKPKKA
jgi:ATP-dependent RNA helicase DDX52/ROK1